MTLNRRADNQTRRLIQAVPYFAALGTDDLVSVATAVTERRLGAGEVAFVEGGSTAGLYLVVEGQAKIVRYSQGGREQVLALLNPGDSCNEVPVVDGGPNPATLVAVEPTVAWIWSRVAMNRLRQEIAGLNEIIITSLATRCRELVDKVYHLSFLSVSARLAAFLLGQAEGAVEELDRRRWTQEEMAAHIGTVREMVSRALRNLEEDGLIQFNRHRIEILDREGLASLVSGD
jgi:CRP/FNR family transcriptional regulator